MDFMTLKVQVLDSDNYWRTVCKTDFVLLNLIVSALTAKLEGYEFRVIDEEDKIINKVAYL